MKEEKESVNLQTLNQVNLPKAKKKKVKLFLYSSAIVTTFIAGINFIEQNYLEGIIMVGCTSGLWAFSNSIHATNQTYLKRLKIYQKCSMLASTSFLLNGILKPEEVTMIVNLFCSSNMLLLHHEFTKEKKCYTLSNAKYTVQKDNQK